MKRFSVIGCLVVAIALMATQSAFAARVYNFLPSKVHVTGLLGGIAIHQITLAPGGARSDSLGWGSANIVRVDGVSQIEFRTTDKPLCLLNYGVHAEMQGGNYMTIGHNGSEIVCTMCGSEHNVTMRSVERTNYNWQGNSRTGC